MGGPNFFVPVAMLAFLLATAVSFPMLDRRRVVLVALLGGSMFLPDIARAGRFSFIILNSKAVFVPAVVFLCSLVFDTDRWLRFRPRLIDLPVAVLCLGSFASAIHNDLGLKEAAASAIDAAMVWGMPYLLGRAYLGQPRALKEFAAAVTVASLVYAPFCLWEIRMGPGLHRKLYGYLSEPYSTMVRDGGAFRPSVFMQSGLEVALFMAMGTLTAFWLWRTRALKTVLRLPLAWVCPLLAVTTLLCRSAGAIVLLAVGLSVLEGTRLLRSGVLVVVLAAIPAAYCAARVSGSDAEVIVALSRQGLNEERARSLEYRIENEKVMVKRAKVRPWLGWGRFGRSFVYDETGRLLTVPDSMWILALGYGGLVHLVALGALLAIPSLMLLRVYPARLWASPSLAPAAAIAVVVLLWAIDDLVNAMMAPMYPMMAGALVSFVLLVRSPRARQGEPRHARVPRAHPTAASRPGRGDLDTTDLSATLVATASRSMSTPPHTSASSNPRPPGRTT